MGEWINGKKIVQAWNVIVGNDIYTVPWTPYHDTSTIVGWSSFTNKLIHYKKVGDLVFVRFHITGTSNHILASFTLPFTHISQVANVYTPHLIYNNGVAAFGYSKLLAASATLLFYPAVAGGNWVTSGIKYLLGNIWYITP